MRLALPFSHTRSRGLRSLYMRRLSLLLFRCHGLCISVHALWTRAVRYAEKMQDHPLCVLEEGRGDDLHPPLDVFEHRCEPRGPKALTCPCPMAGGVKP
jgi:hypothetical protein